MGKIVKLLAKYYPVYLSGLWGTLWISAVTVLLGLVLGMLVALMRMSRSKLLNAVSGVYIEVLRGHADSAAALFLLDRAAEARSLRAERYAVHRRGAGGQRFRVYLGDHPRGHRRRRQGPVGRPRGASAFPKRMS